MSYELPTGKSPSFIAYGTPEAVPAPDGTTTTGRPQVYVRWFDSIKISKIVDGGRTGKGDTVAIEFDAKSVDFDNDFMAYMNPDDPTLDAIKEAHTAGSGIQIALESVRKVKSKSSNEPIAKTTPIHALRGAKQDGSNGKMDASGDNIRNLVAMVDGMTTSTIHSNPKEWKFLAKNRTGELAPEGWRFVSDKDDWTKLGFIIPTNKASTGVLDDDAIAAVVAGVVEALGGQPGANGGIESNEIAREIRRGVFNEGKPWNVRTSNGMVNLGSYLLSKNRAVFVEAMEIVNDTTEAAELTRRILNITDQVQAATYGNNIKADRLAPSHAEAGKWVSYVLTQGAAAAYPMEGVVDDVELETRSTARDEWGAKVANLAGTFFAGAAQVAREYLESLEQAAPKPEAAAQGEVSATSETASSRDSVEADAGQVSSAQRPQGAKYDAVRGLAQRLTADWNDFEALSAQRPSIATANLLDAPLAIRVQPDGSFIIQAGFDIEDQEGWARISVVNAVNRRLYELQAKAASQEPDHGNIAGAAETSSPAEAPAQQEPATAQASTSYSPEVVAMIQRLKAATRDDVAQIFADAKDGNLLDMRVAVKPEGNGVAFGQPGQVGFVDQPLSAVISRFVDILSTASAASSLAAAQAEPAAELPIADAPVGAEPAGDESDEEEEAVNPGAQDIAAEAKDAGRDIEKIDALILKAKELDLSHEIIRDGENEGGLMYYLVFLKQEAEKQLAPA